MAANSNIDVSCEFRTVPGYQAYDVSSCGTVRSYWRSGGHGRVKFIGDIPVLMQGSFNCGTIRYSLTDTFHRRRTIACGSIVLRAFSGIKKGHVVGYLDGDRSNCHLSNLSWVTAKVSAVSIASKTTVFNVLHQHSLGRHWCGHCSKWKSKNEFLKRSIFRCRECHNDVKRKHNYGVDQSFIDRTKHGKCDVCGIAAFESERRLSIDHCHATGSVRGILCGKCNTAIGMLGDDPERLILAADYLKRTSNG